MSPSCSQLGDDRIEVGDRVDLAALDGGDRGRPGADADERRRRRASGPSFTIRYMTKKLVEEPGAVTPIFRPLRSAKRLDLRRLVLLHRQHDAGEAAELDHRLDVLALGLHADGVLVGARDHVDRAADQRLQRLRAAGEIVDGDVEALLLEVAEPLGERQRQVVEQALAADAERQVRLLERLRAGRAGERKRQRERASDSLERASLASSRRFAWPAPALVGFYRADGGWSKPRHQVRVSAATGRQTSSRFSIMVTSVSITITKAASTNMPANTPATSKVPSACWMM